MPPKWTKKRLASHQGSDECGSAPAKRSVYTDLDDTILVDFLISEVAAGKKADGSFKEPTWVAAAEMLNKSLTCGALKTSAGCRDHFTHVSCPFLASKYYSNCF